MERDIRSPTLRKSRKFLNFFLSPSIRCGLLPISLCLVLNMASESPGPVLSPSKTSRCEGSAGTVGIGGLPLTAVSWLGIKATKPNGTEIEQLIDPPCHSGTENRPCHVDEQIGGRRDPVMTQQLIELNACRTAEA